MSENKSLWDTMPLTTVLRRLEISRWPSWLSRWLGYRASPPPKQENEFVIYFWAFMGSFCTIAILQAIFGYETYFEIRQVPSIIASFGASALLCFEAIKVPFSQPRALVGGHIVSAFVGIAVSRLIGDGKEILPQEVRWLAGALSTALAIVAMKITKTTHPPAGATALLVASDPAVYDLGWYYLPIVILSSIVVLVLALFFNNIQRQYPTFWISPPTPPAPSSSPAPVTPAPQATAEEDPHLRKFLLKLKENTRTPDSTPHSSQDSLSPNSTFVADERLRHHEMVDLERGYSPQKYERHLSI